jgi:hypothetical protein
MNFENFDLRFIVVALIFDIEVWGVWVGFHFVVALILFDSLIFCFDEIIWPCIHSCVKSPPLIWNSEMWWVGFHGRPNYLSRVPICCRVEECFQEYNSDLRLCCRVEECFQEHNSDLRPWYHMHLESLGLHLIHYNCVVKIWIHLISLSCYLGALLWFA